MKKIVLIVALLSVFQAIAQDAQFSQKDAMNMLLNPASVGTEARMKVTTIYRTQWNGIGAGFQTTGFGAEAVLNKERVSSKGDLVVGINFINDRAGTVMLNNTYGSVNLAYQLKLSENHKLGLGIYTGFGSLSVDLNRSKWSNQFSNGNFDPSLNSGESFLVNAFSYLDAGAGFMYHFSQKMEHKSGIARNIRVGGAAFHVNRPTYSFIESQNADKLNMRISSQIMADFPLSKSGWVISPMAVVNLQQTNKEIVFGTRVTNALGTTSAPTNLFLGVYNRLNDAVISQFGVQFGDFTVGFSYDASIGAVGKYGGSKGAFEVFLKYAKVKSKGINTTRI